MKQFSIAFAMYASDYDGVYPCPGGRGFIKSTTPVIPPTSWVDIAWYSTTNGVDNANSGLYPYIKHGPVRTNWRLNNDDGVGQDMPAPRTPVRP